VYSWFYLRKWLVDSLIRASVAVARPLYTTIYLPTWLRMLGAKIGVRAEISTVSQISPELVRIGDESFFADGSIIGGRHFFRGRIEIGESRIGRRSFVGNSAILPIGASLGEGCLLGCLSAPPERKGKVPDGTDWVGSPSFRLPRRQKVGGFDDAVTYRPTRKLYAQRLLVDALRILIPGFLAGAWLVGLFVMLPVVLDAGALTTLAALPLIALASSVAVALAVVAVKLALIPRFRPIVRPLWSPFVWFNEVINGAYESVAVPMLSPLLGTPFFAMYLRLLGCSIGKSVFLNTTLFSEFDLVHVGDRVALNAGAVIQNHLFEDRIMKASTLFVEDDCSVGNMAVILYDTRMRRGAKIGPLSLLMKGEVVPESTDWLGIPTRPQGAKRPLAPRAPVRQPVELEPPVGAGAT
jgi:non-ribosomal peptide synthetase-like protein